MKQRGKNRAGAGFGKMGVKHKVVYGNRLGLMLHRPSKHAKAATKPEAQGGAGLPQ
jgi:hypothetical protein